MAPPWQKMETFSSSIASFFLLFFGAGVRGKREMVIYSSSARGAIDNPAFSFPNSFGDWQTDDDRATD
jgi:hypothetical protein